MLDIIGQLLRLIVIKQVTFHDCPEMVILAEDGEEPADLHNLLPEQILLRWVNYHLKKEEEPPISNLDEDLKDCETFLRIMKHIDHTKCTTDGIEENDPVKRAEITI